MCWRQPKRPRMQNRWPKSSKERRSFCLLSCGSRPAHSCRLLRLVGGPVVGFIGRVASPAIEGVIKAHASLELLEIVEVHARQPEGGGEQAWRFGRKIESGRVRAPDDRRE